MRVSVFSTAFVPNMSLNANSLVTPEVRAETRLGLQVKFLLSSCFNRN
jgi:hypothetical protein